MVTCLVTELLTKLVSKKFSFVDIRCISMCKGFFDTDEGTQTTQDDAPPNTNPKYEQKCIEFNTPIDFGKFHEKELAPARKPKLIGKQFLGGKLPLEFPYHAELRKRPWIEKHFPFMITFLIEQILFKRLPKSNKQTDKFYMHKITFDQRSSLTY